MPFLAQDALDYSSDAQVRVARDTRVLQKTISLTVTTAEVALPSDVIKLSDVFMDSVAIPAIPSDEAMRLLSGDPVDTCPGYYTLEPGIIGFYPAPTSSQVDLFYTARPAVLDSDDEFELTGQFELLIEHLALHETLDDDSQPELAMAELGYYQNAVSRAARDQVREMPNRIRTP